MRYLVTAGAYEMMVAMAYAAHDEHYGFEACGLLVDRYHNDESYPEGRAMTLGLEVVPNVATRPGVFVMDVESYRRKMEFWGDAVVGTWHSHPSELAVLSKPDVAQLAMCDDRWVHLVMSIKGHMPVLKGYFITDVKVGESTRKVAWEVVLEVVAG